MNGKSEYRYCFFVVKETELNDGDGPDDPADYVIRQDYPRIA